MSDKPKKKRFIWILLAVAVAIGGFLGYRWWQEQKTAVPKGIAYGNGRLEAKLVDVAAKEPLRVKQVLVQEGDLVKPGEVVVILDTVTLDAQLAEAKAQVSAAREKVAAAQAAIVKRQAEIDLARIEAERARKLVEERAGSQQAYDVRKSALETTTAAMAEDRAKLQTAQQEIEVANANVAAIQSRIDDSILKSPVTGRVLYRLAEPGEVLGSGGKAITLVNLEDVYMEIFLPAQDAARVRIGAEARMRGDYEKLVAPGYVSFVSPEAQFTPKQVETKSEREKLMFRVKIQVPQELVGHFIERIKTGVRGVGYVKLDDKVQWPAFLQNLLTPNSALAGQAPEAPAAATDTTAATTGH